MVPNRHIVSLLRPTESVTSGTNATVRDYATPATGSGLRTGLFQERAGRIVQAADGQEYTFDAMFYSDSSTDFKLNDVLTFAGEKYLVLGVERKFDLDGRRSHTQVLMTREYRR